METLIKRNGTHPVVPVVSTILDDFFSRDIFDWTDRNFAAVGSNLPSVNLKETDTKLEVEMAVPGMKKEDFKVQVENNMLRISSEKKEEFESTSKKDNYIRKEFNYHSFHRTFSLPESIDESKIQANYKDGILRVAIDKKDSARKKAPKLIDIK